jgi:AcrR family transcriptional regulator
VQYAPCMEMAPETWPTRPDPWLPRERTSTLRERKRRRTRRALVEAAVDLFDRQGYDQTTVAEIAAGAQVSARSFFSYFGSKEEILFPDSASRVQVAADAIASRGPGQEPAEVLAGVLQRILAVDTAMASRMAQVRMRLIIGAQAGAMTAALVELFSSPARARQLISDQPARLRAEMSRVTELALAPWRQQAG